MRIRLQGRCVKLPQTETARGGWMVNRTSHPASNRAFRVRILVGLLRDNANQRKGHPDRGLCLVAESSVSATGTGRVHECLAGSNLAPSAQEQTNKD